MNINKPDKDTLFLDIDGTLVAHNYSPEEQEDVILPGVRGFLDANRDKVVVIVTGRSPQEAQKALDTLSREGCYLGNVKYILSDMPTGTRILINDTNEIENPKAVSINLLRNTGFPEYDYGHS
jgi:hydroxymethylpyrimidine pyrophosphatase-like HAD family hydrolase